MVKKTLNFIKMSKLFENFCVRFHFAASSACQQHRETDRERQKERVREERDRLKDRERERESYINETNY